METPTDQQAAAGQALPATLAMLSHEFRTPLNGVLGMARLLETTRLTAEQRSYVEALKTSGDHLLGLVNDLLDLARLDAGKTTPDLSPVEIEPMLQQVCELMSPRAQEKGIEIAWAAQAGLAPTLCDEGRLRQILLNFAGNAVKFTGQGGVLVTAELDGELLRLAVRDTGPGVEPESLAAIFEPFSQGAAGAKAGGAGLGLAIVRRLAASLGAEVSGHNLQAGGAEFRFEVPYQPVRPAAIDRILAGRIVAVACANGVLAEAISRQLAACGAQALVTNDVTGLAKADVVLIDHALLSGRRAVRPPSGAPAIALIRPEDRERIPALKAAGWAGYLIKPLRRISLAARILAALQSGSLPAAPQAEDERAAAAAAPGARVLLAEDNPINALLAGALLEREGCVVTRVHDGESALAKLNTERFDLILMDVRMPGLGGLEAVRTLRARGISTPVAAFTADAFDDDRRACLSAGMDDFLVKPLTPAALRGVLARWVGPRALSTVWTPQPQESKLAS